RSEEEINSALEGSHRSTHHTTPDTSNLVFRVQRKAAQENLHKFQPERAHNDRRKAVVNIQLVGEEKLKSSTLGTFNKKVLAMAAGIVFDEDEDECPTAAFGAITPPDDLIV
ncbi:hypothetical protein DFH09DRAFT_952342, partial [Mycena vulgaris]